MSKMMLVVNLHEIDFLNEVLAALARMQVRDCVVQQVECVPSNHMQDGLEPSMLASIAGLFKPQHKINYLINAVADQQDIEQISTTLKPFTRKTAMPAPFGSCPWWVTSITK